jgi:acetyltransferase-like isoleucine patch superfamily enzyme
MLGIFALITKNSIWKLHSVFIVLLLRMRGCNVGSGFYTEGVPKLFIRGRAENIIIGNNVRILGPIDLRNRENGKIVFEDDVTIEHDCRFVAAREGSIQVGRGSVVTAYAIINGGGNVIIGQDVVIGPRCSINANEHVIRRDVPILPRQFEHGDVVIEDQSWLAANVVVTMGTTIRRGSVIAANAVVNKDTEPYSVNGGVPARKISDRK